MGIKRESERYAREHCANGRRDANDVDCVRLLRATPWNVRHEYIKAKLQGAVTHQYPFRFVGS
jgi:hypothetical protein